MYGATKPNCGPYSYKIYDSKLDELDESMFNDDDFTRMFSIRNKSKLTTSIKKQ